MNARSVTFELAQKIRGPAMTAGEPPLLLTTTPAGPGQHGGFKAQVIFKFKDYNLAGSSGVKPTLKEAKDEACQQIRQGLQDIWDEICRRAEPKITIPCPHCEVLLRPHAVGEHLMLEHSLVVLESCEKVVDASFKQTVAAAIETLRKEREDNLSMDSEL